MAADFNDEVKLDLAVASARQRSGGCVQDKGAIVPGIVDSGTRGLSGQVADKISRGGTAGSMVTIIENVHPSALVILWLVPRWSPSVRHRTRSLRSALGKLRILLPLITPDPTTGRLTFRHLANPRIPGKDEFARQAMWPPSKSGASTGRFCSPLHPFPRPELIAYSGTRNADYRGALRSLNPYPRYLLSLSRLSTDYENNLVSHLDSETAEHGAGRRQQHGNWVERKLVWNGLAPLDTPEGLRPTGSEA